MKYFIDTEFIEGFHKPLFGKKRHFIDLISIGIVCEDGRQYYAISNEYKFKDADKWVQENVITPMYIDQIHGDQRNRWSEKNFHLWLGKSNAEIAEEIIEFIYGPSDNLFGLTALQEAQKYEINDKSKNPEFYGYYADYDWVLFCSLFGRMIDLPKGFPMYCRDLKQMIDEAYVYQENKYPGEGRLESWLRIVKNHPEYPIQKDEHNALSDALWNKELYDFITQKKFLNKSNEKLTAKEIKS